MRSFGSLCLTIASLASCLAPPVVLPALEPVDLGRAARHFAPGWLRVEVPGPNGGGLVGVHVEASADAPLVLVLQEATGSVGSLMLQRSQLLDSLAELGLSALILDYTGVGLSAGERSASNLAGDAWAMWELALRLVGGDAQRVALRATSLGTIAAAELVARGARPACVTLVLPVEARSIVSTFGHHLLGFPGALAALAFRTPSQVDACEAFAAAHIPITVIAAAHDDLLPPLERERFLRLAQTSGGRARELEVDHFFGTVYLQRLTSDEILALGAAFPGHFGALERASAWAGLSPAARAALEADPRAAELHATLCQLARNLPHEELAALAMIARDADEALELLPMLARPWPAELSFDERIEAWSLDDAAERIHAQALRAWCGWCLTMERVGARGREPLPEEWIPRVAREIHRSRRPVVFRYEDGSTGFRGSFTCDPALYLAERVDRGELALMDARIHIARLFCRGDALPERVRLDAAGRRRVEVKLESGWTVLDLADPAEDAP